MSLWFGKGETAMRDCVSCVLGCLLVVVLAASAQGWEGVYMVHFAQPEDFADLRSRGVRQVLQNVTLHPDVWQEHYSAAVEHDLKLIPILWGTNQTAWQWNRKNSEWELSVDRYPASIGARFLDFLRNNRRYLAQTFAVYSFHEPMNPENEVLVSPDKQRKFWEQIHTEEFPEGSLKIYGEDVTWHEECKNGCVDYDSISLYNFARSGNRDVYRPVHIEKPGPLRIQGWADHPTRDREKVVENGRRVIDIYCDAALEAPPASDNSRTRYIVLIQTYAMSASKDWCNRLPSAREMRAWATEIVGERRDRLAGMSWYCYRQAAGHYTHWLHKDRYDDRGEDRWQVISQAGQLLSPQRGNRPGSAFRQRQEQERYRRNTMTFDQVSCRTSQCTGRP
jgi:hypothetical protein